jgi:heme/copper-type cytochrome/quinol oxidase subunit 4
METARRGWELEIPLTMVPFWLSMSVKNASSESAIFAILKAKRMSSSWEVDKAAS